MAIGPFSLLAQESLEQVADTRFSVDRGFYTAPFTVAITSATPEAEIRYTTDGSPPSAVSGLRYTGPIAIHRTTVLRAMALKPGLVPSNVDTQTYLFLDEIAVQNNQRAIQAGFPASWPGAAADYAMDPRITGPQASRLLDSLRSLPSALISTSVSNLFDPASGIYANPERSGSAWERPVSVEWLDQNGQSEFQVNCGLRIQGGYFRGRSVTQKHSFRLLFKAEYGDGKLRRELFAERGAAREFDTLVLRAGANDGYSWDAAKDTEQFTRDEFGRRLQLAMGHPAPHGRFVHLYLNGLYWGLYNLTERPNEDFSATHFGGQSEEWDSINSGDVKNGDLEAWNDFLNLARQADSSAGYRRLQGQDPSGARHPAYPVYLDAPNYIDYMILNMWGGNWDWPYKNYWFGRRRTVDSTGFKFYLWDFENTMGNNRGRSPTNMVSPPAGYANSGVGVPHYYLQNNPDYRLDFADRVQRYFFHGGLLTPPVLTNRYRLLADQVERAIIAESARWGDDHHSPPQDLSDWFRERDWILNVYLPIRSQIVLQQFRAAGLYPDISAPVFSQPGGLVPPGFSLVLQHTNPSGTILYTLDGSDPRDRSSSGAATGARPYQHPIAFDRPTLVKARVLSNQQWSALTEHFFHPPQDLGGLQVTEIMYHAPNTGSLEGDEFDFLELQNAGPVALDLSGLAFTSGFTFAFTNHTILPPGAFFLLARNPAVLAALYPDVPAQGQFSGKLDNGGETLTLSGPEGTTVLSLTYDDRDPWPAMADGTGLSLQRLASFPASTSLPWIAAAPTPGRPFGSNDTDGDGLPDAWERANGTRWDSPDADADPDRDGFSNAQEFFAGTRPADAASALRIVQFQADPGLLRFEFQAVSNRTYSVFSSTSLASPWSKVMDVSARPTTRQIVVTNLPANSQMLFFRIRTPQSHP